MDGHDVKTMNTGITLKTNEQFHSKIVFSLYVFSFYRIGEEEIT